MIILDHVTKIVGKGAKKRAVLTGAQASLPSTRRIALLGPRAEDKRIFINLLAGVVLPDSGRIIRNARVSFPAGHIGGFTNELPVRVNVAHVARLYGADVEPVVDFVAKISKLEGAYDKPYGDLSKVARLSLSQILAFSIPFDVYLLSDEIIADKKSNIEVRALFGARAKTSGMIIASEDPTFAREFCDMGLVLSDGQARLFDDLEQALAFSEEAAARLVKEGLRARRKREKGFAHPGDEQIKRRKERRERKAKRARRGGLEPSGV